MAGFIPAIHVLSCCEAVKTWMAGTSPAMTVACVVLHSMYSTRGAFRYFINSFASA
jgi:hypothetical protein